MAVTTISFAFSGFRGSTIIPYYGQIFTKHCTENKVDYSRWIVVWLKINIVLDKERT